MISWLITNSSRLGLVYALIIPFERRYSRELLPIALPSVLQSVARGRKRANIMLQFAIGDV